MKSLKILKFISLILSVGIIMTSGAIAANAAVSDNTPLGVTDNSRGTDIQISYYNDSNLPSKYSSVDLGYVTEIKNQTSNDCWAYAGVATLESKLLREGINVGNMSAPWANVWATKRLNGKGWQRSFDSEGYNHIMPGYFTSWYGGILESDIQPVDLKGKIYGDLAPENLAKYGTTSIRYLSKSDPAQVKQAIMDNGGVYTGYAQSADCMTKGISYYMPKDYAGTYFGHSVEIVGWDDDYSRMNFGETEKFRPQNNGAWLVRNSWGNYNSLGGYFWISYEDNYVLNSKYDPSFTIEEVMKITDDVKLKQNEIYGSTYEFQYVVSDNITYINKFDFSDDYNIIDKVVFETKAVGADYDIYYIPVENEVPDSDENNWIKLDSGTVEFSGYICADFEDFSAPKGDGAIAVKIDTTALNAGKDYDTDPSYVINSIGVSEWLKTSNGDYTFINDSKSGDCFIKYDKNVRELLDWYKYYLNDEIGGTFVIKAITREDVQDKIVLGDVNLDGYITIDDVTLTQKYIANMVDLTKLSQINADVDKNTKIDIDDVTTIQKYIAGIYEF